MNQCVEPDQSVVHIVFVHGWAMLASGWEALIALIRQRLPGTVITSLDCYDPSTGKINWQKNCSYIWVGHSFGFLRLWLEQPDIFNSINNKISAAISINSFTHLPQSVDESSLGEGNLSKTNIDKMLLGLQKAPEKTLKHFYRQAGLNRDQIRTHLAYFKQARQSVLLQQELMLMQNADVRQTISRNRIPILALGADHDRIVGQKLRQQSFARLYSVYPTNCNRIELKQINSCSHCLHLAETAWCADAIIDFIKNKPGLQLKQGITEKSLL